MGIVSIETEASTTTNDENPLPNVQVYGAQPPNELLRQAIDSGGFYDTQKLFFKGIKDVVFLAACAPPGGGRNQVSPRLLRHFSMVWLTALSTDSLNRIFQAWDETRYNIVLRSLFASLV